MLITINGTEVYANESVDIIEGSRLLFTCSHSLMSATFRWSKDNQSLTWHASFEITNMRIEDKGRYTCTMSSIANPKTTEITEFYIRIIYPPALPVIEAPRSAIKGESISLTCSSDAVPKPSYQWKQDSPNGQLLSRNMTYYFKAPAKSFTVCCTVEQTMIPTIGKQVTVKVNKTVEVDVQREAIITSTVPYTLTIDKSEGEDVNLLCSFDGKPVPDVWWTKRGDNTFHWIGGRYVSYNVDKCVSGDYTCHVENTVVSSNGSAIKIHKTKDIHVRVHVKKNSNKTTCLSPIQTRTTHNFNQAGNTSPGPMNRTKSTDKIDCSSLKASGDCDILQHATLLGLIVATVSGWLLSTTVIVYFLCCGRLCKTKNKDVPSTIILKDNGYVNYNPNSEAASSYLSVVGIPDDPNAPTYDQLRDERIIEI